MPRRALGPRIWFESRRGQWIIRDGSVFIRTGCAGWAGAEKCLAEYMRSRGLKPRIVKVAIGAVYFVTAQEADFPIKIGFSQRAQNLAARLEGIQNGCPYKLSVAAIPCTYQDESALHRKFAAIRMCGEWFKRTPELMAEITVRSMEAA